MVFCNLESGFTWIQDAPVTILILIDGFLQYKTDYLSIDCLISHNPYFNRWFSAINDNYIKVEYFKGVTILILIDGFLQFSKSLIKDSSNWSQSLF